MWGWEPREETLYEYADDGSLLRTVTHREPEFDDEQVALLLASHLMPVEPRGSHGYLMSEATDPKNQRAFKARMRTDWAARAIADADDLMRKQYPDGNHNGHVWDVELLP